MITIILVTFALTMAVLAGAVLRSLLVDKFPHRITIEVTRASAQRDMALYIGCAVFFFITAIRW